MNKFTLPAGTTNRHKWHKEAAAALSAVTRTFNMRREIYGQHGGEERESLVSVFGYGDDKHQNPDAVEVYEAIGERFAWEITRENAADVAEAFREALPACMATVPVDDSRTTPEQDEERAQQRRDQDAERKAKSAEKSARVEVLAEELRKQYPNAEGPSKKSEQARAAANLKRLLQARGLRASVKSDSFSMGDSVTALVKADVPPATRKKLDEIAERFSYSTFDPMTDSQGYKDDDDGSAWRQVFGRTKYCRIEWEQTDAIKAAIAEFLGDDTSDEYGDGAGYRVWTGAHHSAAEFWAKWAEDRKPVETATASGAGFEIQKHHHDKRGYDYWLVVLAERVERDEYLRLRSSAKAAGGWYSRKWRSTPGGFGFKEQEQAGAWAVQEFGGDDTPPPHGADGMNADGSAVEIKTQRGTSKRGKVKAAKFREMADKVAAEVEAKRGDHQENTPKRQREAMSRRIDADRLERTEQALRALADLFEAGEVPPLLQKFTSKKAVFSALGVRTVSNGYYHVAPTDERTDDSPEAAALWQLVDGKDPGQEKADKLAEMLAGLPKLPGYFPTPPDVVAEMVDRLAICRSRGEPWLMLEPSAGSGAILDEVEQLAHEPEAITVYEINPTLCEVLRAKGYDARPIDFMEQQPGTVRYDAVLMNPPFEKLQDVEHVRHAFEFLKPGGRLVAIMSPGAFYRETAKAREFQEWFEGLPCSTAEDIEAGAFKESGTGVASKLVVIDKPDELPEVDTVRYPDPLEARDAGVPAQGGQMLLI